MKTCSNPDCPCDNPQPNSEFYTKKRRCRTCLLAVARAWREIDDNRKAHGTAVEREGQQRLTIGPLRSWLRQQVQIEGLRDPLCDGHGVLAHKLGIHPRRLWGWLNDPDQKRVTLDAVDAAFCSFGDPSLLRDIYPELYPWDEQERAA